jgi:hypothetical protein
MNNLDDILQEMTRLSRFDIAEDIARAMCIDTLCIKWGMFRDEVEDVFREEIFLKEYFIEWTVIATGQIKRTRQAMEGYTAAKLVAGFNRPNAASIYRLVVA